MVTAKLYPLAAVVLLALNACCAADELMEIQVTDSATGRGIPLVELITVDDVVYVTDNAGRVALNEPQLRGQTLFLKPRSPGYQAEKDGFGIEGVRITVQPGEQITISLERLNIAERLYRITGRDLYRDSLLLQHKAPIQHPLSNGLVVGQDSVQTVVYEGRLHWFWGDTSRLAYPLGLFRTAGAVSDLPGSAGLPASAGINLTYFTNPDGFARAMVQLPESEGVVWIQGLAVLPDEAGRERMVCSYSRRRGLQEPLQQGHLVWNDQAAAFERLSDLPLEDTWRLLQAHPIRQMIDGRLYLVCGNPFPTVRVPAELHAISRPDAWEAWTCVTPGTDPRTLQPARTPDGQLDWGWKNAVPVSQQLEQRWLREGLVQPEELRFLPENAGKPGQRVLMHGGSVCWNAWRNRWILIANAQHWERGEASFLGEVYYSEADSPQGPFTKALRVATHPGQSFYNPCQHVEFDEQAGRCILFEGTYTNMFTNSPPTPRYNYNQLMYRLDLGDGRVQDIFGESGNDSRGKGE
ncbi:MAG: hypothetical protein ACKO2P_11640 [Planctomycetota bacterium]